MMARLITYTDIGPLGRFLPRNNEVALLGDSRNANYNTRSLVEPLQLVRNVHWAGFVQARSRGAIRFPSDLNFAVSGATSADMISGGKHTAAANSRAGSAVIFVGTNSFNAGVTAASVVSDVTEAINALVDKGKLVFVVAETPRGTSALPSVRLSTANLREQLKFRDWVLRRTGARALSPLVIPMDLYPSLADQSYNVVTGDLISSLSYDGLHPNGQGSFAMSTAALAVMLPYFPSDNLGYWEAPSDLYNASNPSGNLVSNGMLGGAVPVSSNGLAGNWPTGGWTLSQNTAWLNSGSPATLTGSQVSTDTGAWFQIVASGTTGAGSNPEVTIYKTLTLTDLAAGDRLQVSDEIEVDDGAVGLITPRLYMQRFYSSGSETVGDRAASQAWPTDTSGVYCGRGESDAVLVDGTETSIRVGLMLRFAASTALSATVRVRKLCCKKVL